MKTIGKKLKAIYVMAVIALVSICMSFIPLMTNTVKADVAGATAGLRITGAQVKTIDGATQAENGQFAVYFHAEITEEFYNTLQGDAIQFGMLVGPKAMLKDVADYNDTVAEFNETYGAVVTNQTVAAGKAANFKFVGTNLSEAVEFTKGVKTFEAGVIFDEANLGQSGIENVLKKAAATDLVAIPYYVVDDVVSMDASSACTRNAKDILVETAFKIENEVSLSDFDANSIDTILDKYVGDVEFVDGEYYWDKNTAKAYVANANNELVAFDASSYVFNGVASAEFDGNSLADGSIFGVAYVEDGAIKVAKATVATRIFFTHDDFYKDVNGNGTIEAEEKTRANYIFNLNPYPTGGACIPRIAIKGLYVLANNIDLKGDSNLSNRATNDDGTNGSGELTVQVWNDKDDIGFRGTLDGRGFALLNANPYVSSAGMFGAFYGATVKNIAFDGFTNSANNSQGLLIGHVYRSTFENVYIRAAGNANGESGSSWRALSINDTHGGSNFINVVFESVDGLAEGKTSNHQRFTFIATNNINDGTFTNTSVVGMPIGYSYGETTKGSGVYQLNLLLPTATMTTFGVEAAQYAVADAKGLLPIEYTTLITNVEKRLAKTITYVTFIEDTKEGRAYYLDSASLAASESADVYAETGCWIKLGDELFWKSLVDTTKITVDCSAENGEFKDSVSLDMYYGNTKLDAEITLSGEGVEYVTLAGNTITRKANAQILADKALTATLSYNGIVKTVELTLLFDIDKVVTYESGEFVIDKHTGKVLKANANNELKAYDATGYLAGDVTINGVAQTVLNRTEFAFDKANLTTLADGEKLVIISGENYLVARVVTKVFFELRDFFNDADGSGVVEDAEMIFDNNFFNQKISSNKATVKITGYYVLANNINAGTANTSTLRAGNANGAKPSNTNEDFGFQGTFDGRGFALSGKFVQNNGSGLFGLVKNATIKNIAIMGLANQGDDANNPIFARYIYDSTLENVYITVAEYSIGWNQRYKKTSNAISGISNSTLTNVVFENNAWKSNNATIQRSENSWYDFGPASANSTYTNTYAIGAPITVSYSVHVAATDTEVAQHKLVLRLPLATIQKYVAAPGVYALADCGGAQNDYAKLISGINIGDTQTLNGAQVSFANIQYIEFVAETSTRGYYYDRTAIASDTTVANALIESGCWTKVGGELVWTSNLDQSKFTAQTTAENGAFAESTTVDMYYNGELVNAELSVSKADAEFVVISGNTITKKAGVKFFNDKVITVTATYQGIERTMDLTMLFDINTVETYEDGEFVIDKHTGKVLKADDTNKLVAYDATSYLAGAQSVSVADVAQTVVSTEAFAFDVANLATLADGEKVVIVAGENALVARVVTRVLSKLEDFFNDLNGDGIIKDLDLNGDGKIDTKEVEGVKDLVEITTSNSIFHMDYTVSWGNATFNSAITGYYVLANNINLNYKSEIGFASGDIRPYIPNNSIYFNTGFMGTLDGRGFALNKANAGNATGGIFGILNGATIKNIAFKDMYTYKNDGSANFLANNSYNTTFENVYVSVAYPGAWGDNYMSSEAVSVFGGTSDVLPKNKFINVIVENTVALESGRTQKFARAKFGNQDAEYTNTTIVGLPAHFTYTKPGTEEGATATLSLTLPASNIAALGLEAGSYAIADFNAVTTAYAGLVANIEAKYSVTVGTITLVEDTTARAYYIDNATLSANAAAVEAYVGTGFWKVNDAGSLVWAK